MIPLILRAAMPRALVAWFDRWQERRRTARRLARMKSHNRRV